MEFQLAYHMGIDFDFNDKDYFEFVWCLERLSEEKRKEKQSRDKKENTITPDMFSEGMTG